MDQRTFGKRPETWHMEERDGQWVRIGDTSGLPVDEHGHKEES